MEAIYDRNGKTVGWRRADGVYALDGRPTALIWNRNIHDLQGRYLGRFEDGWFREPSGRVVGFIAGATGGPLPPTAEPPPMAPRHILARLPERFEPTPPPPFRSTRWSDRSWEEVVAADSETAVTR